MIATLQRETTGDQGTFGTLTIPLGDGTVHTFRTGELPWRDNADNLSCIPAGRYEVRWTYSPHFNKHTFQIMAVSDRDGCRFHSGNFGGDVTLGWESEIEGCTLLGSKIGVLKNKFGHDQAAVLGSAAARDEFERLMNEQTFMLDVIDVP